MDTKEIEEIKADVIKKNQEFEAQIGRSFAPEFISSMKTLIFKDPGYPLVEIWVTLLSGSTDIKIEYHLI